MFSSRTLIFDGLIAHSLYTKLIRFNVHIKLYFYSSEISQVFSIIGIQLDSPLKGRVQLRVKSANYYESYGPFFNFIFCKIPACG